MGRVEDHQGSWVAGLLDVSLQNEKFASQRSYFPQSGDRVEQMVKHAEKQNDIELTEVSEAESRAIEINRDGLDIDTGGAANQIEGLTAPPVLVRPLVLVEGDDARGAAARCFDRKSAVRRADIED